MQVTECRTAEDVRACALQAYRKRQALFAPKPIPVMSAKPVPLSTRIEILAPVVALSMQQEKISEIIEAVASTFNVSHETIRVGADPIGVSTRRLTVALCVRRQIATRQEVAEEFGIQPEVITSALRVLDPILSAFAISNKAALSDIISIIAKAWVEKGEGLPPPLSIKEIQQAICKAFYVTYDDLISPRRTSGICGPRQVAMGLVRRLSSKWSLPEIGRKFGGRDHTTILHGIRKVQPLFDRLEKELEPGASLEQWAQATQAAYVVMYDQGNRLIA
jgi:chromosomal replication initiation ATPase DnaA